MSDPVELLRSARTIAVVGFSRDPRKTAHSVPVTIIHAGYDVIPVNPTTDSILGRPSYPTLLDIPGDIQIDLVNVFRPSSFTPEIARQAVARGAKALWLQTGIASAEARAIAEAAGMPYVEDTCIAVVRSAYQLTRA